MEINGSNKGENRMVEVALRFKTGLQEATHMVSRIGKILDSSRAELLEWDLYMPSLCDQNNALEDPLYNPEGGCGYTVQS